MAFSNLGRFQFINYRNTSISIFRSTRNCIRRFERSGNGIKDPSNDGILTSCLLNILVKHIYYK